MLEKQTCCLHGIHIRGAWDQRDKFTKPVNNGQHSIMTMCRARQCSHKIQRYNIKWSHRNRVRLQQTLRCTCGGSQSLTRDTLPAEALNVLAHMQPKEAFAGFTQHLVRRNMAAKPRCMQLQHDQALEIRITWRYDRRIVICNELTHNFIANCELVRSWCAARNHIAKPAIFCSCALTAAHYI